MPSLSLRTWTLILNNPETVTAEMDPSKMHIKRLHKGMVRVSSECLTRFNLVKMSSGCTPRLRAAETTQQKVSTCPPAPTESSTLSPPEPRIITFLDRGWRGFPDFPTGLCHHKGLYERGMEAGEPGSDRDGRSCWPGTWKGAPDHRHGRPRSWGHKTDAPLSPREESPASPICCPAESSGVSDL